MRTSFLLLLSSIFSNSFSQEQFPDLSAKGSIKQKVGFTTIKIDYERPAARGRRIFGELIPYGQLWRTGAGNCTKISFNKPVEIGGAKLEAGSYSLLTIPGEREWIIILNKDTTLYGTDSYNEKLDVVRFASRLEKTSRYYESFTFDLDVIPNNANIYLSWANSQVHFTVETGADQLTTTFIQQNLLSGKSRDPDLYATAAEYYVYKNRELDKAFGLINKAITLKEKAWYYRLKTDILEKQEKYPEAIDWLHFLVKDIPKMSKAFDWDLTLENQMRDEYNSRIESINKKLSQTNAR
jgi:tetratricopeptide (TPR) repeat protein